MARILYVPGEYETIQQGLDDAERGDTVKVAPGVYYENIVLRDGRNLVGSGADETIITDDKEGSPDPIVEMDGDCLLTGFTITGARGAGVGHAIMIIRGAPFIVDNRVCDNSYTGIGIHSETHLTAPLIIRNKIYGNGGAGIANLGGFARGVIRDNDIYSNTNAGVACTDGTSPLIENNRIFDNGVGIASKEEAKAVIVENMIHQNKLAGIPIVKRGKAIIRKNEVTENGTVGINVDESSEAWIVENTIVDNGADGITVKQNSKAYVAFNYLSSGISTVLELTKSQATVLRNRLYIRAGLEETLTDGELLESAKMNISDAHKHTGLGPGTICIRESTYAGGGNVIGGWVEVDRYSKLSLVPMEDWPVDGEAVKLPDYRQEIKGETVLPEQLLAPPADLMKLPVLPQSGAGCLFF